MSPDITLQEGALFIADAHDSSERNFFLQFLHYLSKAPPPQLFLMGDMFDLLVGGITYTERIYEPYIGLINDLSKKCEIVYFEGNHDFNLQSLFPYVRVIPIQEQPVKALFCDQTTCLLLHGDAYEKRSYAFYTAFIRHPMTLKALNTVDTWLSHRICKAIMKNQKKKYLCRKIESFKALIDAKIGRYPLHDIDFIVEGHYHQGVNFTYEHRCYINFSSFACQQIYFCVHTSEQYKFVPLTFQI